RSASVEEGKTGFEGYSSTFTTAPDLGSDVYVLELSNGIDATPYAKYAVKGMGSKNHPLEVISGNNLIENNRPTSPQALANRLYPVAVIEDRTLYFTTPDVSAEVKLV